MAYKYMVSIPVSVRRAPSDPYEERGFVDRPVTPAGRVELICNLLDPRWVDDDGVEHRADPFITREQAMELMEFPGLDDAMAMCGPLGVDANGSPV